MKKQSQIILHRVITMLNRQEMDFLDKIGKDALFSSGHKLSYNDILRCLVDLALEAAGDGEKIDSINILKKKIFKHLRAELGRYSKE